MGTLNVSNINGGQLGGFRNLIINGNFQVNQRGHDSITEETSGTPATGYHYDRWYYDGTYLYQGVEDKSVANGTYTLSWVDAGSGITAEYVVSIDTTAGDGPNSGLSWNAVSNGGNITVNEGTEYSKHLWVRFGGTLSNLSKVQLEHGTQATPFEHRPYGTELALCQRYYIEYGKSMNASDPTILRVPIPWASSNVLPAYYCFVTVHLPVEMRANGTFTAYRAFNGSGTNLGDTSWGPFTPTSIVRSVLIQKKANSMTGNQTMVAIAFDIDSEL